MPPVLAAGPHARYVVVGWTQRARPRSGCALGAFVPLGRHGAEEPFPAGSTAWGRPSSPRLRKPASRSCSACPGSAGRPHAVLPAARSNFCAMPPQRHARPAAHTLRAVGRVAAASCSSAHMRSAVQGGRHRASPRRIRTPLSVTVTAAVGMRSQPLRRHPAARDADTLASESAPHRPSPEPVRGADAPFARSCATESPRRSCPQGSRRRGFLPSPRPRHTSARGTPRRP